MIESRLSDKVEFRENSLNKNGYTNETEMMECILMDE